MTRRFPATDIVETVVKDACPMTREDWNIILRLGLVGRIACMAERETPAFHDYGVMLYREFGLDYREETTC